MKLIPTDLSDVALIEPQVFKDSRGFLLESYSRRKLEELGIVRDFVQDNISFSNRGVLRGLHYQLGMGQAKLVKVIQGRILDVAVDVRRGSPSFSRWVMAELSAQDHRAIFIPEGFAHGFLALEDAMLIYKSSDHYRPDVERGIAYNDPTIGIHWPAVTPHLSLRDAALPRLESMEPEDFPVYLDLKSRLDHGC